MCHLLGLFFSLSPIIGINFLIIFLIIFFIIAINFFGTNYLLLLEGMAIRSMRVGVSIWSPLALGLDCQVFGVTICGPRPNKMRKSSPQGTRMASAHAIIGLIFLIIAIIVRFWAAFWLNFRAADHKSMITKNRAILRVARAAHCDCRSAETVSILVILI